LGVWWISILLARLRAMSGAKASYSDSYQIDIAGWADETLVLATVLAIDCVAADSSSNH